MVTVESVAALSSLDRFRIRKSGGRWCCFVLLDLDKRAPKPNWYSPLWCQFDMWEQAFFMCRCLYCLKRTARPT